MNPEESKSAKINEEAITEQIGWVKNGIMSPREKNLVIIGFVFGLLVLCLLCAITMTIIISSLLPKKEFCLTPHCLKKAGSILRAMNRTAEPCKDFFNFVCGGWVEEYDVDEDSEIAIMGKMQTKIYKKFYRIIENVKSTQNMSLSSSTDNADHVAYAGIKAIKNYDACNKLYDDYNPENIVLSMEAFGGWPMAVQGWAEPKMPLEKKIVATFGGLGVASLFSISVEPDEKDSTKNIIKMSGPELSSITEEILEVTVNIAKNASNQQPKIEGDKKELIKFIKDVQQRVTMASGTEDVTNVKGLGKHFTTQTIDWEELFKLLLEGETNTTDAANVANVKVVLRNKEVIDQVLKLAAASSERVVNNYFATHILSEHPLLMIKVTEPGANTKQVCGSKASVLTELKENCLQKVAQFLNFAMDHVFVYKQNNAVMEAGTLIDYIQKTFMDLIEGYTWLEQSTKERLKKKLKKMNSFINYPDWLEDKGKVDDYYKDYIFDDSNPVASYVGMVKYGIRKVLATYKEKNNRDMWPRLSMFSVSTVNAFYLPRENNFVLPRAILNPPIYDENNPKYLTYGSIGAIIGHEITHGFDSEGRHYDEEGRLATDIWTTRSTANYVQLSECFIKQYSEYIVDEKSGTTVDGNKTLAENIADNGGLRQAFGIAEAFEMEHDALQDHTLFSDILQMKVALKLSAAPSFFSRDFQKYKKCKHYYEAYHTWLKEVNNGERELSLPGLGEYSPKQMFFISYGQTWCISAGKRYLRRQVTTDEHTPHYYRVIGTLSNMEEFSKAFSCPSGSPMNRQPKCVLW